MSSIPAPEITVSDGLGNKKTINKVSAEQEDKKLDIGRKLKPPGNFTRWFNKIPPIGLGAEMSILS